MPILWLLKNVQFGQSMSLKMYRGSSLACFKIRQRGRGAYLNNFFFILKSFVSLVSKISTSECCSR